MALIKLRALHSYDESTIEGLVRTLSQLNQLGLRCIIIVDGEQSYDSLLGPDAVKLRAATGEADRLITALERKVSMKANRVDGVLSVAPLSGEVKSSTVQIHGPVEVQLPSMLYRALRRGVIPVVPAVAYTKDTQALKWVEADDVMLAITRELAGVRSSSPNIKESDRGLIASSDSDSDETFTLDRIIVLDPAGALPSMKRADGTHVFFNLEQEYAIEKQELLARMVANNTSEQDLRQHVTNLELCRDTLALLPPTASALLTTPSRVAMPALPHEADEIVGVRTRSPKNPLIFNLLANKPLISSSLPPDRTLTASIPGGNHDEKGDNSNGIRCVSSGVTFVKKGMPLTLIPDPKFEAWSPPRPGESRLSLEDPRIDFPRLLNLIEDSFGRPLDVSHYLDRIRSRIAGIIVAGEYEGGAILTWELAPGIRHEDNNSDRMVPYLDKFAVLRKSQGEGGVADIVFSAMVRSCFPEGVVWRSRKSNVVNGWYFQRAAGTWKIPNSQWTMFWTDPRLQRDEQRWRDAVAVCRTVAPSWADNKEEQD